MITTENAIFNNAFAVYLTLEKESIDAFREGAKDYKYYSDIRLDLDGEIVDMTYDEFKRRMLAKESK